MSLVALGPKLILLALLLLIEAALVWQIRRSLTRGYVRIMPGNWIGMGLYFDVTVERARFPLFFWAALVVLGGFIAIGLLVIVAVLKS